MTVKALIQPPTLHPDISVTEEEIWMTTSCFVVAGYNFDIGNLWKAMERSRQPSPTFWDINNLLPGETKAYVMNFITLNVTSHNYELFLKNKMNFTEEKMKIEEAME